MPTTPPGSTVALTTLADGQHGVIAGVRTLDALADGSTALRLGELGFLPGEPVRLLRRGPGGREPIAVQVGDTVFALRWIEAHGIDVIAEAGHV